MSQKAIIFLCTGCELAQKIDLEKLKDHFNSNAQVESIQILLQLCDVAAKEHLKDNQGLLLFGACDERTHGTIFKILAGPNPHRLVNLRERCAWVHDDVAEATGKAQRLLSMGLAELTTGKHHTECELDLLERVLVIGAGPAGLACARGLAEQACDVTIIEKSSRLGGTLRRTRTVWPSGEDSEALLHRFYDELQDEPHVTVYQETELAEVSESNHGYFVRFSNDIEEEVGAIVVATGVREVGGNLFEFEYRWRDRGEFRGPLAFEVRKDVHPFLLETALWDAVMLRHDKPDENIFFFIPENLELPDGFTESAARHRIEITKGEPGLDWKGAVVKLGQLKGSLPLDLAQVLRIPIDNDGYAAQRRFRIRPQDVLDPGIFVVGGAHAPMPMEETINHAFVVAARIKALFDSKPKRLPTAQIDEETCIGCGYCAAACPYGAPILERTDTGSKAHISSRFCTLCGLCISGCPVFAISDPIKSHQTIKAQIQAWPVTPVTYQSPSAQPPSDKNGHNPKILGFTCDWAGFALDYAGMLRQSYSADITFINLRCSARFDLVDGVEALSKGADGIFFALCSLGDCHYQSGNHHAVSRINHFKYLLEIAGLNPDRIGFAHADTADAVGLKNEIESFCSKVKGFGDLSSQVFDKPELVLRVAAMKRVCTSEPVRWTLSKELELVRKGNVFDEKLDAEQYARLVKDLLRMEYEKGLILELLSEPRSAVEVAEATGLPASRAFELIVELERETRARFEKVENEHPLYVEVADV